MQGPIVKLGSRRFLSLHLILEGIIIGLLVGLATSIFRLFIAMSAAPIRLFIERAQNSYAYAALALLVMCIFGLITAQIVKFEPMISGSGIPQVSAQLQGRIQVLWHKTLLAKMLGSLFTLGSGLTLGREGPSVQIGGMIGDGVSHIAKRSETERRYLLTAGSAAGLASAFNAPLAGAMFALEELHKNFSPTVLVLAMVSAYSSVFLAGTVLGTDPVVKVFQFQALDLSMYWAVILIGIITGLSGVLFNKSILGSKLFFSKLAIPKTLKLVIPFAISAIFIIISPNLFGSGLNLMFLDIDAANTSRSIGSLFFLLLIKFFLLLIAFGSGLPGGLFFPLLVLGALEGNIIAHIGMNFGLVNTNTALIFIILAMCGHLSSIVRSPLTAILLVFELTGSLSFMLPLGIVSLVAYFTAELLGSRPIYASLQDMIPGIDHDLPKKTSEGHTSRSNVLVEFSVEPNSVADGKMIRDLGMPTGLMIVSLSRGSSQFFPGGSIVLQGDDFLECLIPEDKLSEYVRFMEGIVGEQNSSEAHLHYKERFFSKKEKH